MTFKTNLPPSFYDLAEQILNLAWNEPFIETDEDPREQVIDILQSVYEQGVKNGEPL